MTKTRLRSILCFVGLVTVVVGGSNFAFAGGFGNGPRCEYLFTSQPAIQPLADLPDYQTVQIVERVQGYHGQEFYRLRKLDPSYPWGSRYAARTFDPQGDPSWGFAVFGSDLARVLGLRYDSNGDILAPTPETLNRRVARFNHFLVDHHIAPIPVSFYSQRKPRIELFLRQWGRGHSVPVAADDSTHTIHDISYHYSAVLLPKEIVKLLEIQANIAWHWLQTEEAEILKEVTLEAVRRIDNISVTANHPAGDRYQLRFWETIYADDTDEIENSRLRVRSKSHLSLFSERIFHYNSIPYSGGFKLAFTDMRSRIQTFRENMQKIDPTWDSLIEKLGLLDGPSVHELYVARAVELRHAARLFWQEHESRKRENQKTDPGAL